MIPPEKFSPLRGKLAKGADIYQYFSMLVRQKKSLRQKVFLDVCMVTT